MNGVVSVKKRLIIRVSGYHIFRVKVRVRVKES